MALRPFDLIHRSLKKRVLVSMKNGKSYRGKISSYDENLNLFLTEAEEISEKGENRKFPSIVLKGGNIVFITPDE